MNKVIKIYADVEAFFDYRRALLQMLITEGIEDPAKRKYEGDRLWELHFASNYRARTMDTFNYPDFNIDKERFQKIYKERGLTHWATGMYYKTNLIKNLVGKVIDLEGLEDKPINIKEMKLYVNTYPYDFGPELTAELVEHIRVGLKGMVNVGAIYQPHNTLTAKSYSMYNYVFRYAFMLDEDSTAFMESFAENPTPETAYIIPDILSRETDCFTGPIKDWMFATMVPLSPIGRFLPVDHVLYDYT